MRNNPLFKENLKVNNPEYFPVEALLVLSIVQALLSDLRVYFLKRIFFLREIAE